MRGWEGAAFLVHYLVGVAIDRPCDVGLERYVLDLYMLSFPSTSSLVASHHTLSVYLHQSVSCVHLFSEFWELVPFFASIRPIFQ